MILRIWHGYHPVEYRYIRTPAEDRDRSGDRGKKIPGYRKVQLLRRERGGETEFVVIMWFESIGSAREFAGPDYQTVYVPEKARKVLSRYDLKSVHYELRDTFDYSF